MPTYTGVYQFLDKNGNVIYVGKALNLRKRVSSYFSSKELGQKTKNLVSDIASIKVVGVSSEIEAFLLEERLIKKYKPKYNIKLLDGKSFLGLKITIKDEYPKVLLVRKEGDKTSLYFGPFTSAKSLRTVYKLLRRIFPFQAVTNHPDKYCLYHHLGLCPCPTVTKDKNYKRNIKHIIDFLNGDTAGVVRELENERDNYSKQDDFENAQKIQEKINSIKLITSPVYKPLEYELNPNLRIDIISEELDSLKNILIQNDVHPKNLERIECYDISTFQGKSSTASMVVFANGEKDSSSYRRFRIKEDYGGLPNDFAMLSEVLERRLKRTDWKMPSLIIVDGGKGQVSSAQAVLKSLNLDIPLIGLAKKEEIIITSELREVKLPHTDKSLHLLMRIRDEAHRFAINYHRKLRSKLAYE